MFKLKNAYLALSVHPTGAELQQIAAVNNNLEFLWHGDPAIWGGHAPNLFPIVGQLKENKFIYDNSAYHLPRHGFARHSNDFVLADKGEDYLVFSLQESQETLRVYPFKFNFLITYQLDDNKIKIIYRVINQDDKTLYFSVGGHPAFKCPLYPDESYAKYQLRFEHPETSRTHLLNQKTGLFTLETQTVFSTPRTIALNYQLFDNDALVFKDLKSRRVTLESEKYGDILDFTFKDFPFLGIWAKPNANFVCIEPWQGLADSENSNQHLVDKEGIVALRKNKEFSAAYTIEINKAHLQ